MTKHFSEVEAIALMHAVRSGASLSALCREYGIRTKLLEGWRCTSGGMTESDARRLRMLEAENHRLRRLLTEAQEHRHIRTRVTPLISRVG